MKHLCIALICLGSAAEADVLARFVEGAPKDRFSLRNTGACDLGAVAVTYDLRGSQAGLVFDVTQAGAGVQVFQPFELVAGAEWVAKPPVVKDGDRGVTLALSGLPAGAEVAFTIDVDDTKGRRAITVSGAEIEGALVRVRQGAQVAQAPFNRRAQARVALPNCVQENG